MKLKATPTAGRTVPESRMVSALLWETLQFSPRLVGRTPVPRYSKNPQQQTSSSTRNEFGWTSATHQSKVSRGQVAVGATELSKCMQLLCHGADEWGENTKPQRSKQLPDPLWSSENQMDLAQRKGLWRDLLIAWLPTQVQIAFESTDPCLLISNTTPKFLPSCTTKMLLLGFFAGPIYSFPRELCFVLSWTLGMASAPSRPSTLTFIWSNAQSPRTQRESQRCWRCARVHCLDKSRKMLESAA